MKTIHWIVGLGIVLATIGCTPSQKIAGFTVMNNMLNGAIDLKITGTAPNQVLEVANPANPACARFVAQRPGPKNLEDKWRQGCFFIARGNEGSFDFRFEDPDNENVWYFDLIRICNWTKNSTTRPGANCGMTPRQRRDYSVEEGDNLLVPDARGKIDLTNGGTVNMSEFTLTDLNTKAGYYFYWVKVCKLADTSDCLTVDPGSRNGGRR